MHSSILVRTELIHAKLSFKALVCIAYVAVRWQSRLGSQGLHKDSGTESSNYFSTILDYFLWAISPPHSCHKTTLVCSTMPCILNSIVFYYHIIRKEFVLMYEMSLLFTGQVKSVMRNKGIA